MPAAVSNYHASAVGAVIKPVIVDMSAAWSIAITLRLLDCLFFEFLDFPRFLGIC